MSERQQCPGISRDLGLLPREYRNHYALTHIEPLGVEVED